MDGGIIPGRTPQAAPASPEQVTRTRIGYHRNGYKPVPITDPDAPVKNPGKQPVLKNWRSVCDTATEAVIAGWADQCAERDGRQVNLGRNTGLLCGEVVGVDIDVPIEQLATEVRVLAEHHLGGKPLVRYGAKPKTMLLYQIATPLRKLQTKPLVLDDGTEVRIEVLGAGQQFVADGIHPKTKLPYLWESDTPLTVPANALPEVTEPPLRAFMAAAEALLRAAGGRTKAERDAGAGDASGASGDAAGRMAAGARHRTSGGGGGGATAGARSGDFFRNVNKAALDDLGAWCPDLFPSGRFESGTGAFRVSSADLGRGLQEDLSIHPDLGGRDFGTEESCSPIDIVREWHTGRPGILGAAKWLCEKLDIAPETLGFDKDRAETDAALAELNEVYFVIPDGKRVVVAQEVLEPGGHYRLAGYSPRDFEQLYRNRLVVAGVDKRGAPIRKPLGAHWLNWPGRRQYLFGVVFDPSDGPARPGVYNRWKGFSVHPKPGNWSLMRAHILDMICAGDLDVAMYVMNWMANLVQHPERQGEVAIVMCGGEGSGKGTVAKALLQLLGPHGMPLTSPDLLVGMFSEHLADKIFILVDEAFFAGDKAHVGRLKALITEDEIAIHPKFGTPYMARNRLHLMVASNEDWVVPAALDARRYCVLNVRNTKVGALAYFKAIHAQMEAGGYAAMLHDLLAYDLTNFNVRDFPKTAGLIEQKKLSLGTTERWWLATLERGFVSVTWRSTHDGGFTAPWAEEITTDRLYDSYQSFASGVKERDPITREQLGEFMRKMGATPHRPSSTKLTKKGRPRSYRLGTLAQTRNNFTEATGLPVDWDDVECT